MARPSRRRQRDGRPGALEAVGGPGDGQTRMSSASVLVTGATGCLGRHLVDNLVQDGLTVRALTQQSSRTTHLDERGVDVQRGSLIDQGDIERAVDGVQTVFHLGGLVIDNRPDDISPDLWQEIERFNVHGTERLARAAAAAGAKRFVFCSSVRLAGFGNQLLWDEDDPRTPSDLYSRGKALAEQSLAQVGRDTGLDVSSVRLAGFGNQLLWDEDDPRTPSDLYSRGKALAEQSLAQVGRDTGLEVVSIRPRFIYGNYDRYVMPQLVRQVMRGWVPLPGGGRSIWGVVYVQDCVQALRLAAERAVAGKVFNITS